MGRVNHELAAERALQMAMLLVNGETHRAIANKFGFTSARVGQIVAGSAIKLWIRKNPQTMQTMAGHRVWPDIFHRKTTECAVYLMEHKS
jgi:hypothetical protein